MAVRMLFLSGFFEEESHSLLGSSNSSNEGCKENNNNDNNNRCTGTYLTKTFMFHYYYYYYISLPFDFRFALSIFSNWKHIIIIIDTCFMCIWYWHYDIWFHSVLVVTCWHGVDLGIESRCPMVSDIRQNDCVNCVFAIALFVCCVASGYRIQSAAAAAASASQLANRRRKTLRAIKYTVFFSHSLIAVFVSSDMLAAGGHTIQPLSSCVWVCVYE